MAKVNLTARTLASLKPRDKRYYCFDRNLPGFCVSVTPAGVKSYSVMYRHGGRLRRYTIGTEHKWSLADARDRAREVLRAAAKGQDPAGLKQEEREAARFEELADDYMERWAKKRKKTWREDRRMIDAYLMPRFKGVRAVDVTRAEVRRMLEEIAETGPVTANRVLALIRKMYNWALGEDLVSVNPCSQIPRPSPERRRDRVLSEEEIRAVWKALDRERPDVAALFRLRLLTAQRGGEVASMLWDDVKEEAGEAWWIIPAERSKNGLPHRVPLPGPAQGILEALRRRRAVSKNPARRRSPYVFPARRGRSGHVREHQKAAQRIRESSGVGDFRAHDLRRTAASHMTGMGVPRLVVGRILNHAEPGVTAVYDRHSYDKEKREALEAWAKRLMRVTSGLRAIDNP